MANGRLKAEPAVSHWRRITTAVIFAAVALTGFATALAIYQARTLSARVMRQAELRAEQIAASVGETARERITAALVELSNLSSERPPVRPERIPDWIAAAFSYRRGELRTLRDAAETRDAPTRVEQLISERPPRPWACTARRAPNCTSTTSEASPPCSPSPISRTPIFARLPSSR